MGVLRLTGERYGKRSGFEKNKKTQKPKDFIPNILLRRRSAVCSVHLRTVVRSDRHFVQNDGGGERNDVLLVAEGGIFR